MSQRLFAGAWLACLATIAATASFGGCGTLSTTGTISDAGLEETSSSSSGGSSGSSSGTGSSSGSGSSSGATGSSSGTCTTPLTSVPATDVPAYVPVQPQPSACTTSQIVQFAAACAPGSPNCVAWFTNTANGFPCGACLNPGYVDGGAFIGSGWGGTMFDGTNNPWPNLPGCVAIFDQNAGCSSVLQQYIDCAYYACNSCRQTDYSQMASCMVATQTAACKNAWANVTSACQADFAPGGSLDPTHCNGLTGIGDLGGVSSLICSGGPPYDGGLPEAGDAAIADGPVEAGDDAGD